MANDRTTPGQNEIILTRRKVIQLGVLTFASTFINGCTQILQPQPSSTPNATLEALIAENKNLQKQIDGLKGAGTQAASTLQPSSPTATNAPTTADRPTPAATNTRIATATKTPSPDLLTQFNNLGIRVDLPSRQWPTSYEAVVSALNSNGTIKPENIYAVVEPDKTWRGWYAGEIFPLKPGVSYNAAKGVHVDSRGNPVFNHDQIFDYSKPPSPANLADIKLNVNYAGFFARRAGVTRNGLPQHTHYFSGVQGSFVEGIEQFALIPVPKDLCPEDWQKAASTRAWRMAVASFRDNRDARDGFNDGGHRFLDILWMNPETRNFKKLPGRMIAKLAQEDYNLSIIERLPAGWPISPEDVSQKIGGQPGYWVFEPKTGEWFFESFPFKPGVDFVSGVGHLNTDRILVGANQAGGDSQIFNFNQSPENMASSMNAPEKLPAVLFARAGGAAVNPQSRHHSWYTWNGGNVNLGAPGIEQATLMVVDEEGCPINQVNNLLLLRARDLASQQPDPLVTAFYWNGNSFAPAK